MEQERTELETLLKDADIDTATKEVHTPFGVSSFSELEVMLEQESKIKGMQELFTHFLNMGSDIIFYPELFDGDTVDSLVKLTEEFTERIVAMKNHHVEEEEKKTIEKVYGGTNFSLFKDSNGNLTWLGVPTNKFIDREEDIISEKAHINFINKLNVKEVEMPKLFIWHHNKTIGTTEFVDYDNRGFLIAGGKILPEFKELVTNLVINSDEEIGMSHGMPTKDIVRNKDDNRVIDEYVSYEFSFLLLDSAANLLTHFGAS